MADAGVRVREGARKSSMCKEDVIPALREFLTYFGRSNTKYP